MSVVVEHTVFATEDHANGSGRLSQFGKTRRDVTETRHDTLEIFGGSNELAGAQTQQSTGLVRIASRR